MPTHVHARVSQPGSDAAQRTADDDAVDRAAVNAKDRADTVTAEVADDWLDEIDEALDEWAATSELAAIFVAGFLQKGGE